MRSDDFTIEPIDVDLKTIGSRIRQRREALNLKQKEIAEQLGVSNNHISYIESGKSAPSINLLIRLCHILNTTPDYLLIGTHHFNNLPACIYDKLKLCSDDNLRLINILVEAMISNNPVPPDYKMI